TRAPGRASSRSRAEETACAAGVSGGEAVRCARSPRCSWPRARGAAGGGGPPPPPGPNPPPPPRGARAPPPPPPAPRAGAAPHRAAASVRVRRVARRGGADRAGLECRPRLVLERELHLPGRRGREGPRQGAHHALARGPRREAESRAAVRVDGHRRGDVAPD